MSTESWPQYVTRISGGARGVDISRATRVSESTITRWRDGKQPTPSAAVSVARAYDQNPLEALIVAGYLNVDEMKQHITVRLVPLSDLSDVELAHEREDAKRALIEQAGKKEISMMLPLVFLILPLSVVFAVFPGVLILRLGLG